MAVSRKVRFEVFKRDRFTCQYCGRKAPDVVLQVDHIEPRSQGGPDTVLNLVTSCVECNGGKGAVRLDDRSVVEKQRTELELLEARREQIDMMLEWHRGLVELDARTVASVVTEWGRLAPTFVPNDAGKRELSRLVERYGVERVLEAMRRAARRIETDESGRAIAESWDEAFELIGKICRVEKRAETDPHARELAYIGGILKRRCGFWKPDQMRDDFETAISWGVTVEEFTEAAKRCRDWVHFRELTQALYDRARAAHPSTTRGMATGELE